MKSLFSLIFLLLFANSAFASNLCDTSCNLTITFPTGGSIEATEALTFTFGTGGVLDLGATGTINVAVPPASTNFSVGGTLALAVGESISFDAGGSLDLGTGGNIDYTNMSIDTTGDITIETFGVTGPIDMQNIVFVNSDFEIVSETPVIISGGSITIDTSGFISWSDFDINSNDLVTFSAGTIEQSPVSVRLNVDDTDRLAVNSGSVYLFSSNISLASETTAGSGALAVAGSLTTTGGTIFSTSTVDFNTVTLASNVTIDPDDIELPLLVDGDVVTFWDGSACIVQSEECISEDGTTYKVIDSMFVANPIVWENPVWEGLKLKTKDDGKCTMTDGKCIDENGVEYKMNEDGELVPVESGSGSINFIVMLFSLMSFLCLRRFESN